MILTFYIVAVLLTCCYHFVDMLLVYVDILLTCNFLHVLLQNLSNEEQVVVIHARTVLTLAEKVTDSF